MHTDIEQIEGKVKSALDYSASHRKFSVSRGALAKALDILAKATENDVTPYDADKLQKLYLKLIKALKFLLIKQRLKARNNTNPAVILLLRNKLKPTDDGKDASIDNKATQNIYSFFINLWDLKNVQSQNRAFT